MNVLKSALQYGEVGFRSFPVHGVVGGTCTCGNPSCNKQGKHPMGYGWKNLASSDPAKLKELFTDEQSNLGIRTGTSSKLIVIDVDPKNGGLESYNSLAKQYGPLDECTLTANTGGGGFHMYYRYEGNKIGNYYGTVFGSGIDIKGNNGYVIGTPSTHISGLEYTWRDGFYEPPELDVDLEHAILDYSKAKVPSRDNPNWTKRDIGEGNRNHRLTQIAGHHRARGHDLDEITSRLIEHNSKYCKPPLPDSEVKKIAHSVSRYAKGNSKQNWKEFWLASIFNESCALNHNEKGVITAVSFLMDEGGGNCIATQDLIALKAGCSRKAVGTNLKSAAFKGWISVSKCSKTNGGKGIFHSYRATIPKHNIND